MAQVSWADEQDIHSVQRSNLGHLLHRTGRLDLHDRQHFAVGAVKGRRVEAEAACSVVGGHTAISLWRIAQVSYRRRDLFRTVQPGQHDTGRA
jgi:hypothetical protein